MRSRVAGIQVSDLNKRAICAMSHRSILLNFCSRALLAIPAILALTSFRFGAAQTQSTTPNSAAPVSNHEQSALQFDVVSIKPTPSSDDKTLIQLPQDSSSFHGAPVLIVLETAFGVEDDRIIGAPSWVNTNRYDIEAKVAPEDAPRLNKLNGKDRNAMLIPVLTDRFHLKYHHETRERPIYALVIAKGGPRLTKGEPPPPGGYEPDNGEPKNPSKEHFKIMTVPGRIEADSIPMYVLADQLTRLHALGRRVVDKTGLTRNYNFTLRWTPDNPLPPVLNAYSPGSIESGLAHAQDETDSTPSSLVTAIQEQLGLRLQQEKDRVDVIVIDHIDPPSPN
ncbi:MAG TPA: TIGR03435 family protein [Terracidiphilus sp.]|jgi:uncharacterized protein (TIGR03435 family)